MSKFNKFLTILCLSAFIFMVGCSKDDKPTPDPNNPNGNGGDGSGSYGWEFLKVGNKWQYERRVYDAFYNVTYSSPYSVSEIVKIEKSSAYSNTDEITYNGDEVNTFGYASDKGLYRSKQDLEYNLLLIQKNYQVGQKWTYTYNDGSGDRITHEVLSIGLTVKVVAGTFTGCVKIRRTWSRKKKSYDDYYFSPKYGIILFDEHDEDTIEDGKRVVEELVYKNF